MIKVIRREDIDDMRWNQCVSNAYNEAVYGYTWSLDRIAPSWVGMVYGNYEAVFPLIYKTKTGLRYLCQASFFQRTAIYSFKSVSPELKKQFFTSIPKRFILWDFCVDQHTQPNHLKLKLEPKQNLILELNPNYETLFEKFNKNTKRNLKAAEKSDLQFVRLQNTREILDLYKQNTAHKDGFSATQTDYSNINHLMEFCLQNERGEILATYVQNKLAAAVFFVYTNTRVYYMFSGVNDLGKETKALFATVNHFIKVNSTKNLVLDFEGSMNQGVARFYKGFGAKTETYFHVYRGLFNGFFTL